VEDDEYDNSEESECHEDALPDEVERQLIAGKEYVQTRRERLQG
jgi:hypothetical protein